MQEADTRFEKFQKTITQQFEALSVKVELSVISGYDKMAIQLMAAMVKQNDALLQMQHQIYAHLPQQLQPA